MAFTCSRPIWVAGRHHEMNLTLGLRAVVRPQRWPLHLRITARTSYRVWCDGLLVACGPARSPHGHLRLDAFDLPPATLVAIEVTAAQVPGYAQTDEPAQVQAELCAGDQMLAATGDAAGGWTVLLPGERVQRTHRQSRQRAFAEAWRCSEDLSAWRRDPTAVCSPVRVEPVAAEPLLPRLVPRPSMTCLAPVAAVSTGALVARAPVFHRWEEWMRADSGKGFTAYPLAEWEVDPMGELAALAWERHALDPLASPSAFALMARSWRMVDFAVNRTGFLRARLTCQQPCVVYLVGDELEQNGTCDCRRLEYLAGARFALSPGVHDIEMAEPLTARYAAVLALDGAVTVEDFGLRTYERATSAVFESSDPELDAVFAAAVRTFAHNAVDIYLDCPSRERAGWLCDSFFTGRAEPWFTGGSQSETVFLDNYLRSPPLPGHPPGMLAKCYPADPGMGRGAPGKYIPTWALWLVLELEEYAQRGGDAALITAWRARIEALFGCLAAWRNADGLLEDLPSWVFIDWSAANEHVQGINHPANLLYAAALDAAARLFGTTAWAVQAAQVRTAVVRLSWDETYFHDRTCRETDGRLVTTAATTEACQYHAFAFGAADPGSHPALWQKLLTACSAAPGVEHPDLPRAGWLPALHLRLMLLARYGERRRLHQELVAAFLPMTRITGTLWEHEKPGNSCDHAFGSHVAHLIIEELLGLRLDRRARTIAFTPPMDLGLEHCRAGLPVDGERLECAWRREGSRVVASIQRLPAGWRLVDTAAVGSCGDR